MHILPGSPNRQTLATGNNPPLSSNTSDELITFSINLLANQKEPEQFISFITNESLKHSSQEDQQIQFLVDVMKKLDSSINEKLRLRLENGNPLTEDQKQFLDNFEIAESRLVTHIRPIHDAVDSNRMEEARKTMEEACISEKISKLKYPDNSLENLDLASSNTPLKTK